MRIIVFISFIIKEWVGHLIGPCRIVSAPTTQNGGITVFLYSLQPFAIQVSLPTAILPNPLEYPPR